MDLQDFSSVAERTGTYTAFDYADIMEYLIKRWNIEGRRDLTGEVRAHAAALAAGAWPKAFCITSGLQHAVIDDTWYCTAACVSATLQGLLLVCSLDRSSCVLQACEAAGYLVKQPDRIRKLAERTNARKQKNKGAESPFAWVFDRPVELV